MERQYHGFITVIFYMTILNFDELNSFQTFKEMLVTMPPSRVMEEKERIRDEVEWLLEFAYMLGFDRASEELGVIAEDLTPFLPADYADEPTDSSNTPTGNTPSRSVEDILPKDYDQRMHETVWKDIKGKNFSDRVLEHAEMGDKEAILRVVETDGNRVYNSGGLLGARGIAKTKTWETMMDDRVREQHSYLQSVTVPIDEDFYTYDGDHAPQPGGFEDPALNINCRCFLSFQK